MPVAKLKASNTTNLMKTEEGNDSLDTFIRQAIGKEPPLSFSRAGDSPVQWIQLLQALDQQDISSWPLLTPLKMQMQKCNKCTREFYSSINHRRHIRVHHRLKKLDKDSAKNRDQLGFFWDKLSEDKAKELLSFEDVSLEDVPGSSVINSLIALKRRPGFISLPQYCLKAGSALLDIIQSRPSRFPVSSEELFRILDDASEKTFLCGAVASMQKYIFDGEAGKIGLETKNLIACTSFLVELKLVKAWLADKDAEALRCQKLLVEEEEAAQRRQAELLDRKRWKKLRQKEQKAKELLQDEETDLKERIDDALQAVPLADLSCPLTTSDSCTNEDVDFEIQTRSSSGYNESGTNHDSERQMVVRNSRRHTVSRWRLSPNSQWNHMQNGFRENQNSHAPKHRAGQKHGIRRNSKSVIVASGTRKWSRKTETDFNGDISKTTSQMQTTSQPDENKKHEILIGSISVTLGNCSHQDDDNLIGAREDFPSEHPILTKNNFQDKHNRPESANYGANRSTIKLWRPVSRNGNKETVVVEQSARESQGDFCIPFVENSSSLSSIEKIGGGMQFSCQAAKAFLAERWKEAIATEHVKLVVSPDIKSSECDGIQNGVFESSMGGVVKAKFRSKLEKGVKLEYIPKQRTTA